VRGDAANLRLAAVVLLVGAQVIALYEQRQTTRSMPGTGGAAA